MSSGSISYRWCVAPMKRAGVALTMLGALAVASFTAQPANAAIQIRGLVLEADELVYDFDLDVISAIGDVVATYQQFTLTTDRLTYYQETGRLFAIGNVVIADGSGNVYRAVQADVTEDFREGFIQDLFVTTEDRTFFTADEGYRFDDNFNEFYNATYTACEVPVDPDAKPPLWQIRSARIVHNEEEEMVYFHDARLEFLGVPIAYTPYLATPDPSVTRKTGFLAPDFSISSNLGVGVTVPFFWAPAPNYDLTITPTYFIKAGLLAEAEWRHRMSRGIYTFTAAGIYQKPDLDPSGRVFRGAVRTTGDFRFHRDWHLTWDGTLLSDRHFGQTYGSVNSASSFVTSTINLTGVVGDSYLDIGAYHFQNVRDESAPRNAQERQAILHPDAEFERVFDAQVLGGELRYNASLISLTRGENDSYTFGPDTYYYGLAGSYNRISQTLDWRRRFVTANGQVFIPFAFASADLYVLDLDAPPPGMVGDGATARLTGGGGFLWSWPFLVGPPGTRHVIEPVVQVVARPSEALIGALPVEDAQSVILDPTSLLSINRFSGRDRLEGGTRATVALRYSGHFGPGYMEAVIGQSYHLAGLNSYAMESINSPLVGTGLDERASHLVAALGASDGAGRTISAGATINPDGFEIERATIDASADFGRLQLGTSIAFERTVIDPESGPDRTFTINGRAGFDINELWRIAGTVEYDAVLGAVVGDSITLSYECDCASFSITYSEERAPGVVLDRSVRFGLSLRTLGDFNPRGRD